MNIITIDFETFYSQQFSLSKITTEEYVRHELFETIGVAVKVDDGETKWFSGPKAQTKQWLDQFPWDEAIAVAHNAAFDMAILNWHFDIRPKRIADTLSMARALDGPPVRPCRAAGSPVRPGHHADTVTPLRYSGATAGRRRPC